MIRLGIIVILIGYCFHLNLQLARKTNSFSHLYRTCDATRKLAKDVGEKCTITQKMNDKLAFYRKNNDKLLYNYRTCVSHLDKAEKKKASLWLAQLVSSEN
ncbi:MAG: hypothetical protein HRU18_01820 [Pseudoalteromonas sp.]|uniref:hypothetical protein n=1 Tax=Pseudoalteromonas sp. TaxID=53249 RepID=UPI001D4B2A1A|nr:hypothetical protein [Pseudoalteromonas sp.]NRA76920.1 hypothetical protein [Pseudoalteromonas sp.]